jgi:hypothetical protein
MNVKLNRWLILTVAMVIITAWLWGPLLDVVSRDSTHITVGIILIFIVAHMALTKLITAYSADLEAKLWFTAELLVAIGMIGTVTGFILMFGEAFASIDTTKPETISAVLTDMASGMGTALVTTLFGIVGSFMLKAELVFIVGDDNEI